MSTYEVITVVRPDLDEEALNAVIERVQQRIAEVGGDVTSTDRWGKRRIAYPIRKYRDGYYIMTVFSLASGQVARLRQTLGLNEDLLRFVVATHRVAPKPAATPPAAAAPSAPPPPSAAATITPTPAGTAPAAEGSPAPATPGPADV